MIQPQNEVTNHSSQPHQRQQLILIKDRGKNKHAKQKLFYQSCFTIGLNKLQLKNVQSAEIVHQGNYQQQLEVTNSPKKQQLYFYLKKGMCPYQHRYSCLKFQYCECYFDFMFNRSQEVIFLSSIIVIHYFVMLYRSELHIYYESMDH